MSDDIVTSKMEPPVSKKPRIRSKNFSLGEVEALKSTVIQNFSIINAKHCNGASGVTKKMQDKVSFRLFLIDMI